MKKMKIKNKTKKKFNIKIFKFLFFTLIIITSFTLTIKYLINNSKTITKDEYLNYLINKTYFKNTDNFLVKESIKLISKVDLNKPNTLIDNKFKIKNKVNNIKIKKDATSGEDDYKEENYNKITTYIDNKENKEIDPIIYIYNSHQLETYSNQGLENENITPNVMMTSYLLKDELNKKDIPTIVEDTNISEFIKISGLSSDSFYASTRIFIKNAMNKYKNLKYFIDIHRDSVNKDISTIKIDNKSYARILFVLGTTNSNYKANESVMKSLDNISDKLYPGISRGIYYRPTPNWPDSYNQDLNSGVILIEVGGKENTIDEVTNTINALSNIIKSFIKGD